MSPKCLLPTMTIGISLILPQCKYITEQNQSVYPRVFCVYTDQVSYILVRHCRAAPTEDASAPMSTTHGLGQQSRADNRPPPTLVPNL